MVIIGILVGTITSRTLGGFGFDSVKTANGILSLSRGTQLKALGLESVGLRIEPSGSNVVFSAVISGAVSTTRSFSTNEVAITAGTVGSGTSCSSISSTITLNFDSAGEIETVDDDGFPICLNGESSLCISPAGFAHEGACL